MDSHARPATRLVEESGRKPNPYREAARQRFSDETAERAVAGYILTAKTLPETDPQLSPTWFTCPRCATIARTAFELVLSRKSISRANFMEILGADLLQCGGAAFLTLLLKEGQQISAADAADAARTLEQLFQARVKYEALAKALDNVGQPDIDVFADIARVRESLERAGASRGIDRAELRRELGQQAGQTAPVLPTGLTAFDFPLCGGLRPKTSLALIAKPKIGQTVLLGTIFRNLCAAGHRTLYVSLRTHPREIEARLLAAGSGLNALHVSGQIAHSRAAESKQAIDAQLGQETRGDYDYLPNCGIETLRRAILSHIARAEKSGDPIKAVIVDFLQAIGDRAYTANMEEHIRQASTCLQTIAATENVAMLIGVKAAADGTVYGAKSAVDTVFDLRFDLLQVGDTPQFYMVLSRASYLKQGQACGTPNDPSLVMDTRIGPIFVEPSLGTMDKAPKSAQNIGGPSEGEPPHPHDHFGI